jgi:hypothetical protein
MKKKTNIIFEGFIGGCIDNIVDSILEIFRLLLPRQRQIIYHEYHEFIAKCGHNLQAAAKTKLLQLFVDSVRLENFLTDDKILIRMMELILMIGPHNVHSYINSGNLLTEIRLRKSECHLNDKWFSRCSEKFVFCVKSIAIHSHFARVGKELYERDYEIVSRMRF